MKSVVVGFGGEMRLVVKTPNGAEYIIDWSEGISAMEAIRTAGLDIMAICGGGCSCGTCHVHVGEAWANLASGRTAEEHSLVSASDNFDTVRSRLSCQILGDSALDGLEITIQRDAWGGD